MYEAWLRRTLNAVAVALAVLLGACKPSVPSSAPVGDPKQVHEEPARQDAAPGPWGKLHYIRIAVEQPEHFVMVSEEPAPPPRWLFKGYSKAQVETLLAGSGLTSVELAAIYPVLSRFPENVLHNIVFTFNPGLLDERLAASGLQEATMQGFRSLLYPQGERLLFADYDLYLGRLADMPEKIRFARMLSR